MNSHSIIINEKELILETGKLAKQAHGAVVLKYGGTVILATVVCSEEPDLECDIVPLTVDYREKTSAAGKFPGGYIKREGRPSEKEILTSRFIDRPIRPLFPKDFKHEVQLQTTVFSADTQTDPDIFAITAASAALMVSEIPFKGPVASVRVGMINDKFIINPTHKELLKSTLDLVIAGTEESINMVEGSAQEISEEAMLEAMAFGHEYIKKITAAQKELAAKIGSCSKMEYKKLEPSSELKTFLKDNYSESIKQALVHPVKKERSTRVKEIKKTAAEKAAQEFSSIEPDSLKVQISSLLESLVKDIVRGLILNEGLRLDGRGIKDIRPISCEVGLLPRAHGSALFTRGETQALASVTLGSGDDEQRYDSLIEGEISKKFMLHYNFPSFSVGEVRASRGPGRREIGHGALAEGSLLAVLPDPEKFPYTIRIVSDILESNGSSSMATVCAGTLSLMDAGVPIKAAVAGIAMGLVKEGDRIAVLSDILGSEDGCGDMDFKVSGTRKGITGFQLDLKVTGISFETMKKALEQAKEGRLHILERMLGTLEHPRENLSDFAPRITQIKIPTEKIGLVIGPGGKTIKRIIEDTGASIDIEDDGTVKIFSANEDSMNRCVNEIHYLVADAEVGKIYKGKVVSIVDFGAFIEILPGKEGLCHISRIADRRIKTVDEVLKLGQEVDVKLLEIDDRDRLVLSIKDAQKEMNECSSSPTQS